MSEEKKQTSLENLLAGLPSDRQARLLKILRKADISDDDDILLQVTEVLGVFSNHYTEIARRIDSRLDRFERARSGIIVVGALLVGILIGSLVRTEPLTYGVGALIIAFVLGVLFYYGPSLFSRRK